MRNLNPVFTFYYARLVCLLLSLHPLGIVPMAKFSRTLPEMTNDFVGGGQYVTVSLYKSSAAKFSLMWLIKSFPLQPYLCKYRVRITNRRIILMYLLFAGLPKVSFEYFKEIMPKVFFQIAPFVHSFATIVDLVDDF